MSSGLVILGGGQLARMTAQAAQRLGVRVDVVTADPQDPAAQVTQRAWHWDVSEVAQVAALAGTGVVTLENEFVDPDILTALEALGVVVRPGSALLSQVRDKLTQKQALADAGVATARFTAVHNAADVVDAGRVLGWPLMLKARTGGYDGYGNARVDRPEDVAGALAALVVRGPVMVEAWVPFERELAVTVVRRPGGQMVHHAAVQTMQQRNICHVVISPAPVPAHVRAAAEAMARQAADALGAVGSFTVEFFELPDGTLLANEVAPRPHNSAHHTLDSCVTSQFENHVRAALDWPLGDPTGVHGHAVMVNLLGAEPSPTEPQGVAQALAVEGVHLHLYGKVRSRPGRKMGHLTACGDDAAEVHARAMTAAGLLRL